MKNKYTAFCLPLILLIMLLSSRPAFTASYDVIVTLVSNANLSADGGNFVTLEVTEPTGEVCNYWNNVTSIGGWLSTSSDYERYRLGNAMNGYYYIEVIASDALVGNTDIFAQVNVVLYEGTRQETVIIYDRFVFTSERMRVGCFKMPEAQKIPWGISDTSDDGCFVATAAYGAKMAGEVILLSRFRDENLNSSTLGRLITGAYYRAGPLAAKAVDENRVLKAAARAHIAPFVKLARMLSAINL